jgi:hypothetical protein
MKPTQSAPKIRPGQRRPYRKGTRRQVCGRIRAVAELLRLGARKMEIHRLIKSRFRVEWRQCDRYIATALTPDILTITPSEMVRTWLTRARARALGLQKVRLNVWQMLPKPPPRRGGKSPHSPFT